MITNVLPRLKTAPHFTRVAALPC